MEYALFAKGFSQIGISKNCPKEVTNFKTKKSGLCTEVARTFSDEKKNEQTSATTKRKSPKLEGFTLI